MYRILLISMILTGCSSNPPIVTTIDLDCGAEPVSDKLSLLDVEPYAFGEHICMSPEHYSNLAINMSAIKQQIKQKNSIILFYKRCIFKQ
jgi:hypothetical protein